MSLTVGLLFWLAALTQTPGTEDAEGSEPTSSAPNAWVDGPAAPPPNSPSPWPTAPREPGASSEPLVVPPLPAEPARTVVDDGIPSPRWDERFASSRAREELWARGALDLDTALVDVPGLWLSHQQAGAARLLLRGLDEREVAVVLDDVPVFDLGGLLPALEQFPPASIASVTLRHGPRAVTPTAAGSAGILAFGSLAELRDQGESMRLQGTLGGGYGGADLEKGVFTVVETGVRRARVGLHATLLNREDQRLGRGADTSPGAAPGGLLPGSGGSGGAVGARMDVMPMQRLRLFTTWHSSRSLEVPRPTECSDVDELGRPRACTKTLERGLDAWIVGAEHATDIKGAMLVLRGRAHIQHGLDKEERAGTTLRFVDTAIDEGTRGGARISADVTLPAVAFLDAWTPRVLLAADAYGDRFSSRFFSRSLRGADAEPPGLGIEDPTRARLLAGAIVPFTALSLQAAAEGTRATLWTAGQVSSAAPSAELGARLRLLDELRAFVVGVHRAGDDTLEAGLWWSRSWIDVEGTLWGSARTRDARDQTAWGTELRALLRPGLAGLTAAGTFAALAIDDGGPLDPRTPASGVVNPQATLTMNYLPPVAGPALPGFFVRARALLPQQRLSRAEESDRDHLCPERPSDEELAAGAEQNRPCSGAPGAFLFDLGAQVEVGRIRVEAAAENLLDQQGALRSEPIGFGGAAVRAIIAVSL